MRGESLMYAPTLTSIKFVHALVKARFSELDLTRC